MQLKTISKTISNKLTDWLKSINDSDLVELLKKNILVSGGSITSMLLNEKVNDYDIYINDMDVLIRLVKYYTDKHSVMVLDGRLREEYISDLEDSYKVKQAINNSYSIALRTLRDNQVKLFFEQHKGGFKVNESLSQEDLNYTPLFFSPNAISLSNDIQIVCRFHGDNVEIHKTFDFMHATNFFTFQTGLITNKEALESIITKRLRYQGSLYPLTSIIRMKKFILRGWGIGAGEILKIMFQISELNLKDPDVLEEHLIGVDVAYFGTLVGILRGVPPEKLDSEYLNALIDKVFNEDFETEN